MFDNEVVTVYAIVSAKDDQFVSCAAVVDILDGTRQLASFEGDTVVTCAAFDDQLLYVVELDVRQ